MAAGILLAASGAWASLTAVKNDVAALRNDMAHLEEEVHETRKAAQQRSTGDVGLLRTTSGHTQDDPHAVVRATTFDFGRVIPAEGAVTTTFRIENAGKGALVLGTVTTSCGCTSATVDTETVAQGEAATITVTFDPNVHEEPEERFSRSVYVPTNDPEMPEIELTIFVDIAENT